VKNAKRRPKIITAYIVIGVENDKGAKTVNSPLPSGPCRVDFGPSGERRRPT